MCELAALGGVSDIRRDYIHLHGIVASVVPWKKKIQTRLRPSESCVRAYDGTGRGRVLVMHAIEKRLLQARFLRMRHDGCSILPVSLEHVLTFFGPLVDGNKIDRFDDHVWAK